MSPRHLEHLDKFHHYFVRFFNPVLKSERKKKYVIITTDFGRHRRKKRTI